MGVVFLNAGSVSFSYGIKFEYLQRKLGIHTHVSTKRYDLKWGGQIEYGPPHLMQGLNQNKLKYLSDILTVFFFDSQLCEQ
jgi:hypothetical protein